MDILSRLFDEMHLQQVQYISVQASGDWQIEQDQQDYLSFIVVVSGEVYLEYANQVQMISANNMIMLTSQERYRCQSQHKLSATTKTTNMPDHAEGQINLMINETPHLATSDNGQSAQVRFIIVRSHFDVDMARPLLSALPSSLPPPTQQYSAYNEVVSIGVQFFQLEVGLQRPGKTTMLERLASMLMIECIREYVEQLETASSRAQRSLSTNNPKPNDDAWTEDAWQVTSNIEGKRTTVTMHTTDTTDTTDTTNANDDSGNWLAALKDPYLSKTLYLMHRYPEAPWTLKELAKESGLSRSGLSERFKQVIGITPQAYFSHYRLRLAARFLRQEQYSISKISELVGYASDHSFSGAFKRRYGQSPSHYRKACIAHKDRSIE